ncbi:indolepyruvate oxidoreductase subunit beta family protein [Paracoccus aurantiacus]|uniref:Indolepyruvate oxidoreductase subunit beta family protein n=1 Tax=Paracoccus aurantiacus TaxID=2599412 RepID=A0A5C6S0E2_9RHOB|nr:indolepyruvate oxidoreductase subunit beta family protein [Paracoccus aurantiacus]TXB67735.1 indolepyruvate oxidoreductase subunit beta family protein [Paracoccus aurantiacus]
MNAPIRPMRSDDAAGGIIKLAILAVGGQGGGVLTNWIEALARANGHEAQATSVAGVAQRTGATVYYVEMAPAGEKETVFSLMPAAGDVDIMITAELMEAGRAIMRGFVTPDRTTLITSTHRALAVSEKMVPGDGIASSEEVLAAAEIAARRVIHADFDALAIASGSVISATLFGALAGSGALPFRREAFEDAIRAGGKGVEPSLRAFAVGLDAARSGTDATPPETLDAPYRVSGPEKLLAEWAHLQDRLGVSPAPARDIADAGLRKVVDFQDIAYGREYLDRLDVIAAQDSGDGNLTREAAKYIANAMAYDDLIRVADAKTRAGRTARIAQDMRLTGGQLMQVTEFMHPRAEEIVSILPARMGARWQQNPSRMKLIDRLFNRGRRIRSDGIIGFSMLYLLGGMKGWRRRTLRHAQEMAHIDAWLARVQSAPEPVAIELLRNQRLIKGYSDTHARGQSKFARVMEGARLVEHREDAADWIRRLREAALQDEEGKALDGALQTVKSFA